MRRLLTWLVTLPFAAASVLLGHALAYRVTGTPMGDVHGYLEHAPQLVLILASVALLGLAADARARRHSPVPLAALAVVAFVTQEHVERLVHTGHLPFLLTSPVLWLGVVLQAPLAAAVWIVSRRLAEDIAAPVRAGAPRLARLPLALVAAGPAPAVPLRATAGRGRGPPLLS
jgi:hypothetical protein